MKNIAIFASGGGTNARNIIEYFKNKPGINVVLVVSGKADAGVVRIADENQIPCMIVKKVDFLRSAFFLGVLQPYHIDLIVLAGFLWLVPEYLIDQYPGKIINIHPALLPKYGGKGMYGKHVHDAVIRAGEKESGISIHYVNAHYDEGQIIFQASCPVLKGDTADILAQRVHKLEYLHYPKVIENLLTD